MQNYYIRTEDMLSLVSHKLSIIKYVVLKKIIFYFLCFDRLIWTWTWTWLGLEPLWTRSWLGLEPLWTRSWLGLEPLWTRSWLGPLWTRSWLGREPLWTRSWLGLEPLWTWTCLGLDKGGHDYSPGCSIKLAPKSETLGLVKRTLRPLRPSHKLFLKWLCLWT